LDSPEGADHDRPVALTIAVRSGDNKTPPAISFDAPRIVIGRGEGSEVRLPDPSVSHRHASIRQRGTDYIVIDEGSTNGTFMGGVRLPPAAPRVLRTGDLIRVGRIWLEVRIEQVLVTPQTPIATKEIALGLVKSALEAAGENARLRVFVAEGPDRGRELLLNDTKRQYIVGRGDGADLDLSDADASRRHVEIERRGERLFVKDVGSKNGALLDGEPLAQDQSTAWKATSILSIGRNQLRYEDPVLGALAELEQAVDERMEDSESVPPPARAAEGPAPPNLDDLTGAEVGRVQKTKPRPRREQPESAGFNRADWLVLLLALVVLAGSGAALFWIFGG
jgi:pSer/pThr/pTyr-binding forkhead associated (FHA) protein